MIPDFTTVLGVDREHLEELRIVWPTWRLHRPEILSRPLMMICDSADPSTVWERELDFLGHSQCKIVLWDLAGAGQREKMFNGLVLATARHVTTPWYLKLDTDAVAVSAAEWIDTNWFLPDERGRTPAFVSSPWGYTKPPDAIDQLDDWGDTIPQLADFPRLNLSPRPGASFVAHPRIIGWCFFGHTLWTQKAAGLCGSRLPVASQDTFLWYVAHRQGDFYRRVAMKRYGWDHVGGIKRLKRLCTFAISKRMASPALKGQKAISDGETDRPPANRRPPSAKVTMTLARILGSLSPARASGVLVGTIGDSMRQALSDQSSDWKLTVIPFGSHLLEPSHDQPSELESTDFVILEGEVEGHQLRRLLEHWWCRLRPGGIMAGINFDHPRDCRGIWQIRSSVSDFAQTQRLNPILPGETVWFLAKSASPKVKEDSSAQNRQILPACGSSTALAVVTCFFNPANDARLNANYQHVVEALKDQGVRPWTVEVAFGTSAWSLPEEPSILRLRASSLLWQKERALNMLVRHLPPECRYVAWIDADVILVDNQWTDRLMEELRTTSVVQCWSEAEFLDESGQVEDYRRSTAALVDEDHPEQQSFSAGHPGLAWAAHRDLLMECGLYDRHISGGGDSLTTLATFGWSQHRLLSRLSPAGREDYLAWGDLWRKRVGRKVGVLQGSIRHLWHGPLEHRLYQERWEWLRNAHFDPSLDLSANTDGLWEWLSDKPDLHKRLEEYFGWLKESGTPGAPIQNSTVS